MGNRLYVGNISFHTTAESFKEAFSAAGEVISVELPTDRETGQPRGFAFITMGSAQAATKAIGQLNGILLDGRQIKVTEAQENTGGGSSRGSRGYQPPRR